MGNQNKTHWIYSFQRPNSENVEIGDLLVARDVNGMGIDGLLPINRIKEDSVWASGRCGGQAGIYDNAVIIKKDGRILVGEKAEKQINRDLKYLSDNPVLTDSVR
jgi:hypothetical protein